MHRISRDFEASREAVLTREIDMRQLGKSEEIQGRKRNISIARSIGITVTVDPVASACPAASRDHVHVCIHKCGHNSRVVSFKLLS